MSDADDALQAAVRAAVAASEWEGLVTDYVVIGSLQTFDETGLPVSSVFRLTPPGETMPFYRMLGLVEYISASLRNALIPMEGDL